MRPLKDQKCQAVRCLSFLKVRPYLAFGITFAIVFFEVFNVKLFAWYVASQTILRKHLNIAAVVLHRKVQLHRLS